ncbi:fumarylacetoacetate hydrolase family protein [Bacillus carboniphilus]|uniref:Fumarylacetoacetate hydrolase family protein n=1 Tax=Bacillus carboniphilus TaxID=86663 RepID=A0ABN0VQ47_9BACI
MKFVTAVKNQVEFVGVIVEGQELIFNLHTIDEARGTKKTPNHLIDCIEQGEAFVQHVKDCISWVESQDQTGTFVYPISEVKLLAPIPRPSKNIFCIGKNYVEHALEMGTKEDIPEHVMVFTKPPTSVIGHNDPIDLHSQVTSALDYEGELAVIIGKKGKNISREEADQYIFGYTIINDVTARDMQSRHKQFFMGKSLDTSCPMGPWIVHHSGVDNPSNLQITTKVNEETRQDSSTKHLIFPIDELISTLSQGRTLEPGDIIATGTPKGVGKGFNPPRFLKAGDVVEITVEGIGTLTNRVEDL